MSAVKRIDIIATVKAAKALAETNKIINQFDTMQKRVNGAGRSINKFSNKIVSGLKKGQDGMMGFNGAALSTMFFGMQLQKTFGGALKTILDGYRKIIPASSKFNTETNKLSANWEFFKFQLADAMANSPLFQRMIALTINLVKWLQNLSPATKAFLVSLMAVIAALGTWMFISGVIKLGLAGLIDQMGLFTTVSSGLSWGSLAKFGWMGLATAAIVGLADGLINLYTETDIGKKKFDLLKKGSESLLSDAITPIITAFKSWGININNVQELFIVFGAITHNIFVEILILVNGAIEVFRIFFNIIQIIVKSIWKTAVALEALNRLDFTAAKAVWTDWKTSVVGDIQDIQNAVIQGAETQKKLSGSFMNANDINTAVSQFKAGLDVNVTPTGGPRIINSNNTTHNYIIADPAIGNQFKGGSVDLNNLIDLGISPN